VGIIDVLLALVLVEGAVFYRHVFTAPSSANAPVVVAMVLIYYTAIRSFMDWHLAMEEMRYRVLTNGHRRPELLRVFLDFAIMASYSLLLLRAHVLIDKPGANLLAIAIIYPAVYFLYMVWGELLRLAHGHAGKEFKRALLFFATVVALALLFGYIAGRANGWIFTNHRDFNVLFLAAELLLVIVYREMNSEQQVKLDD
jgi:hypothetical protein